MDETRMNERLRNCGSARGKFVMAQAGASTAYFINRRLSQQSNASQKI
jgi:hypothetical protein